MKRVLSSCLLAVSFLASAGSPEFTTKEVDTFQPEITVSTAPTNPLRTPEYKLYDNLERAGLASFHPMIPSYNGKGNLLASWNPAFFRMSSKLTFVVLHGGHGIVPNDLQMALWLKEQFNANVLVLDSFWSRGQFENWKAFTRYGANTRMLDTIAAGRWLKTQGIDPNKTFIVGGSQGGWAVLRTLTDEKFMRNEGEHLFRGGIVTYPVCLTNNNHYTPTLGPYYAPVIVFVGTRDTATPYKECDQSIFQNADEFIVYEGQTHSWDAANRGSAWKPVDGECSRAMNIYARFEMCRSNKTTEDMRARIINFVNQHKS